MAGDRFLTIEGRPTVRVEREYPHPIEKVWQAVTVPEHLGQWFPSPVEIDLADEPSWDLWAPEPSGTSRHQPPSGHRPRPEACLVMTHRAPSLTASRS